MDYISISAAEEFRVITIGPYFPKDTGKEDFFSKSILKFKSGDMKTINAFSVIICDILKKEAFKADRILAVLGSNEIENDISSPLSMLVSKIASNIGARFDSSLVFQKSVRQALKDAGAYNNRRNILKNILVCEEDIMDDNIIVIDDIMTTGATIKTYYQLLKEHNAGSIFFITLGKAYHDEVKYWVIPKSYKFNERKFSELLEENNYLEYIKGKPIDYCLEQMVFPNKTLILPGYYIGMFDKYLSGINCDDKLIRQFILNTSLLIPKIQYTAFKTLEGYMVADKEMTYQIYDSTPSYGAVYFALVDLFYCIIGYLHMHGIAVKKKSFEIYFSSLENFEMFKKLADIYEEIMAKNKYKIELDVRCFFDNGPEKNFDLIISEDFLCNCECNKQIVLLEKRRQINGNKLKTSHEVKEIRANLRASIKNVITGKYINSVNVLGYLISNAASQSSELCNKICAKLFYDRVVDGMEIFLYRIFGFPHFSQGQRKIVERVFRGEAVLGILPTGGGKSVCFQFPAVITSGLTIVICPLRSLMLDQVKNLYDRGIDFVEYIDSSCDENKKRRIFKRIRENALSILYLSPERLLQSKFKKDMSDILITTGINYLVIDEAHCISEWGHDFRPSYLSLNDFIRSVGNPQVIALTATASEKVQRDVLGNLHMEEKNLVKEHTLNRPELSFDVVKVDRKVEKINRVYEYINNELPEVLGFENVEKLHSNNSGLIFTIYADASNEALKPFSTEYASRKISGLFRMNNLKLACAHYHSKLNDRERVAIQNKYGLNDVPILVATKGYGMGVDKQNIRYVLHLTAPPSLEAYYQEGGRAGRNKEHAHCVIFYYPINKKCGAFLKAKKIHKIPCVKGKGYLCSNGGYLCDIGAQLKLFLLHPSCNTKEYLRAIRKLYSYISKKCVLDSIKINGSDKDEAMEKMLCDLKKIELISGYEVSDYKKDFTKEYLLFGIEKCKGRKLRVKLRALRSNLEDYMNMKINMLNVIYSYMEEPGIDRREFMLSYFGDRRQDEK